MLKLIFSALLLFLLFVSHSKAQTNQGFSQQQVIEDIKFLITNAEEIHPNLYHQTTSEQMRKQVDSLLRTLPDSLTLSGAYRALAETAAFVNEGHTGVDLPNAWTREYNKGTFPCLPVQVIGFENKRLQGYLLDGVYVKSVVAINTINGVSAQLIHEQMMRLKGGLATFKEAMLLERFPYYLKVLGVNPPYSIQYIDSSLKERMIQLQAINSADYVKRLSKAPSMQPFTFTMNGRYGYLNFISMTDFARFKHFTDSVFTYLNHQHINNLVIDLRSNSGGNSQLGEYLLSYLTTKPYQMYSGSEVKVSKQFIQQIQEGRKHQVYMGKPLDQYLKAKNGSLIRTMDTTVIVPLPVDCPYKGRVCFLIGPYTFSSANSLAAAVKDYHIATLIGSDTGEAPNDYGEVCAIKLPNTGSVAFTSTTKWLGPIGNERDNHPVHPDYVVKDAPSQQDHVLRYAYKWLDKQ